VLAAALVVAVGSGCSGNGNAGAPATTTRTREGWVARVNAACKPSQKRIDAVQPTPIGNATLRKWLVGALPLIRDQIAAVRSVPRPTNATEAKKAELFVGAMERTERGLTRYLAAFHARKTSAARDALAEARAGGTETRGYAQSLGITGCGGGSGG
jgi:hypothetical protein